MAEEDLKTNRNESLFFTGAKDALPIFLGYFAVSITFGVASVSLGFQPWIPILISLTNYTGSGQALGINLMALGTTTIMEFIIAMIIINVRYSLMSLAISQRLSGKVTLWQRFVLAFGVTDENFAIVIARKKEIEFSYLLGVELFAFSGWLLGTIVGAFAGVLLPEIVLQAFGIALPAMFVAIIIPPCRKNLSITVAVLLSALLSCVLYYVPVFSFLSSGWIYIICGLTISALAAVLFPVKEEANVGEDNA